MTIVSLIVCNNKPELLPMQHAFLTTHLFDVYATIMRPWYPLGELMNDHAVTHDGLPALSSHRWNPLIDQSNVCRATIALPIPYVYLTI